MIKKGHAALEALVESFSREMLSKLKVQHNRGKRGWQGNFPKRDLELMLADNILRALRGNTRRWIDVANIAAFLWYRGQK